jgi:hypothetical protein
MKIEFLSDGADACPLVRLSHFRPDEVEQLRQACRNLADGGGAIALHDQPWVESIDGCRLVLRAAADDVGVTKSAHAPAFELALSSDGWREVEEKLMPFLTDAGGWNWLTDEGDARVLISQSGQW